LVRFAQRKRTHIKINIDRSFLKKKKRGRTVIYLYLWQGIKDATA